MSPADLVTRLRAAGGPLHLMAAEALANWRATADRLQERVAQLEAIARLHGETIRRMQQAAAENSRSLRLAPSLVVLRGGRRSIRCGCAE